MSRTPQPGNGGEQERTNTAGGAPSSQTDTVEGVPGLGQAGMVCFTVTVSDENVLHVEATGVQMCALPISYFTLGSLSKHTALSFRGYTKHSTAVCFRKENMEFFGTHFLWRVWYQTTIFHEELLKA